MTKVYDGEDRRQEGQWHLEKKFSIGLIAAMVMQCASFLWYGAQLDAQMKSDHLAIIQLETWRETQGDEKIKVESTLAVLNQKLTDQGETLHKIDDRLERVLSK